VGNAPAYRIWPPVALGVPLVVGVLLSAANLDPIRLPAAARVAGWVLIGLFGAWNGWALATMARHRTGLLPGQATTTLLERGPFRISRNPLYLGLIILDLGVALLAGALGAVVLLPAGILALLWGAILPEERYLRSTFGAEYLAYQRRVRRWL
jgi:protein-S-isoprenylcysteine O-methyltransferase Ste14